MARGYRLGNPMVWFDPNAAGPGRPGLAMTLVIGWRWRPWPSVPDGHPGRTNVVIKTVV